MLLFIVRHGDPIYDPDSLTPKGHLQAQAVAKRFALHGLDRIYASPMVRARQTARPTCDMLGLDMQIEDWMSESTLWDETSIPHYEKGYITWPFASRDGTYFRSEENYALGDNWDCLDCFKKMRENGAYERIIRCSDDFLLRQGYRREGHVYFAERPNDDRVACFCHQGFGTTWLSHLLQIPPHLFWTSFNISHSSVTVLYFPAPNQDGFTVPQCLALSDLSHIFREGLPYQFENHIDL